MPTTYKKYWLKLRLTQAELDRIEQLGITPTQATHQAIVHWQSLTDADRDRAITYRKHLTIDNPMISKSIGADKATKAWMDTIDNVSLTASCAIEIWLKEVLING